MHADFQHRRVVLAVGELAAFSTGPAASGDLEGGLWRAEAGRRWHEELARRRRDSGAAMRAEVPISGEWRTGGWTLELSGRIDQLEDAAGRAVIREVKTVTDPVPRPAPDWMRSHPQHFIQTAAYLALACSGPKSFGPSPRAELVLVELATGLLQVLEAGPEWIGFFQAQAARLVEFFESRRASLERLRHFRHAPVFAELRPGQSEALEALGSAIAGHHTVMFQAPTGFGKTAAALAAALDALAAGRADRAIFLTGKTTGQMQVLHELRRLAPEPGSLRWVQVRSKSDHCVHEVFHCHPQVCPFLDALPERWAAAGLSRLVYLSPELPDLATARREGKSARLCPYEITRASLPHAEMWVGDYNYIFSPPHRVLFDAVPGFDPSRTLLVVDEAHHLPARAAEALSCGATASDARTLHSALALQGAALPLLAALDAWILLVERLRPSPEMDPLVEADAADALRDTLQALLRHPPDWAALGREASDIAWELLRLEAAWARPPHNRLLWSPRDGELSCTCLDASEEIGATLRRMCGALLVSATLGPPEVFAASCGLETANPLSSPTPWTLVAAPAPWRRGAFRAFVDRAADTRLSARTRSAPHTAATLAAVHRAAGRCIVAFFPSYRYAELVADECGASHGHLRCLVQPRGLDWASQASFLEESLLSADVLCLVLGGSFSEGIDLLGGRVTHAVVVGPALPEANALQAARERRALAAGNSRDGAFRSVYRIPGMTKVNQALGRLVRAPGQRATIVLHCRRFADPAYASLLDPELQFYDEGEGLVDLAAWLERPWP